MTVVVDGRHQPSLRCPAGLASWLGSTTVQALRQAGDAAADVGQSTSPVDHAQLTLETLLVLTNAAGSAAPSEQLGIFAQELQVVLQQAKSLAAGEQHAGLLLPAGSAVAMLQATLVVTSESEILLQAS